MFILQLCYHLVVPPEIIYIWKTTDPLSILASVPLSLPLSQIQPCGLELEHEAKLSMSRTVFKQTDKEDVLLEEVSTVDLLVEEEDVDRSVRDSFSS
jgi:hypothetical protein